MSRGAIPSLIILIFGLILGIWFAVPSQIDIAVIIIEAFAKAMQPLNVERANQIVGTYIISLRILGIILIVGSALGIYVKVKRKEYF